MKRRRILASLTAGLLVLHMAASIALAYDWDLTNGNIIIETTTDSQTVEQGATKKEDKNPVITSNGAETENYIHITVKENGATAVLTIDDAKGGILKGQSTSGDTDSVAVDLTVKGENSFVQYVNVNGNGDASLHITAGEEGASLKTGSIDCGGHADAEMVIDGVDVTAKGISTTAEGNATLEIKDSTVNSVSTYTGGYGVYAYSTREDSEIKITDSEITASATRAMVSDGGNNASITIKDSSVNTSGAFPLLSVGGRYSDTGGEGTILIDNSDVESVGTDYPAIVAGSNYFTAPGTIEMKNCAFVDPGQYIAEMDNSTFVVNENGEPAFETKIAATGKVKTQKNITVEDNGDGSFTLKGAKLSAFQNLKVNGKQLSAGDFTLTEADGVLILTFSDAFLAGLAAGEHTAEINFGKAYAIFTLTK